MVSFKWEDVPYRWSKMRPMVRKILNHPWIVCSHPLTLLSVLRHLWPCGRSQEGPEASLHLSGELASDGPPRAHRNWVLGTDHTVLLRVPLQHGPQLCLCLSPSLLSSRITESGPRGNSAQKLVTSVPSARLSSESLWSSCAR